ncbi:MAG: FHA domain-containing protein [Ilumatobacteraceae bacterium]
MTDQLLNIFKYALLALLYLFFARVLWAVWSEVRGPRAGTARPATVQVQQQAQQRAVTGNIDVTAATQIPVPSAAAPQRARGKKAAVSSLVIAQPRVRRGAEFPLGQEISVGRTTSCTITIPDDSFVSQLHARVYTLDGIAYAEDLGSTNGTYLNGKRLIAPQQMVKGDRLQIGNTIFEAQ